MKRHLLKKEWETYIQDYKNSGLSKVTWCKKQNLPVHRLYYWLQKLSLETENQNECVNWISMNVPVVEENVHATIRIHIQEATIELDVPFTPQVLLQVMQAVKQQ
ncbi:IS66 family insertion sequence element accessory protein TnpB [Bacillus sp. BS98]|uniref:IS66 family insertion sequence element accessory protein TnpA n=1 Tax=Bacillus sp. BS98 TaxID=2608254 RepID=UPI00122EE674|nr:IS66 family insertion sequence element accessory protein TnpB [Bacillus sp. BS98]QEQ20455.1 IS66 family insertion sequence element accessory protein TnpB [Bacillus sp. BS98]